MKVITFITAVRFWWQNRGNARIEEIDMALTALGRASVDAAAACAEFGDRWAEAWAAMTEAEREEFRRLDEGYARA